MDRDLKKIIWISLVFLVFGGFGALAKLWTGAAEVFFHFFPIFGRQAVEDYFTSPYFITGVICHLPLHAAFGLVDAAEEDYSL